MPGQFMVKTSPLPKGGAWRQFAALEPETPTCSSLRRRDHGHFLPKQRLATAMCCCCVQCCQPGVCMPAVPSCCCHSRRDSLQGIQVSGSRQALDAAAAQTIWAVCCTGVQRDTAARCAAPSKLVTVS